MGEDLTIDYMCQLLLLIQLSPDCVETVKKMPFIRQYRDADQEAVIQIVGLNMFAELTEGLLLTLS